MSKRWQASIRKRLLIWLLVPLLSISLVSTLIAYWLGLALSRDIYDKQLSNSADSVVARIKFKDDRIAVDLPQAALAILKHNYQDDFYFQVLTPEGKVISGEPFLPPPGLKTFTADETGPEFRTIEFKGKEVRVVALSAPVSGTNFDHVIIQAAETRNTRRGLANQITLSICFAQWALVLSGALAIWIGVGKGLRPLTEVGATVDSRAPGDLSPLAVEEPVEVIPLVKAINRLFKQVESDIESQKRFTMNAAHQLRTPLAVITTYCDLAVKLATETEVKEVLCELDASITRMSRLVNRLLVLARSEPNAMALQPFAKLELGGLASSVAAAFVPEAIRKKIEIEFVPSPVPVFIHGNQSALEELLSNLIENSITYCPSGAKILIRVEDTKYGAVLSLEDNGPGIAESEREKVFERFYRIPGSEKNGTGLGLSIVKEIAVSHKANITVMEPVSKEGTLITLTFAIANN